MRRPSNASLRSLPIMPTTRNSISERITLWLPDGKSGNGLNGVLIVERDGKILAPMHFKERLLFRLEQEYLPKELVHRQLHAWVQGADRIAQRFL